MRDPRYKYLEVDGAIIRVHPEEKPRIRYFQGDWEIIEPYPERNMEIDMRVNDNGNLVHDMRMCLAKFRREHVAYPARFIVTNEQERILMKADSDMFSCVHHPNARVSEFCGIPVEVKELP